MKILKLTTLLDFGGQEKQYISFTEKGKLLHHDYIFVALGYGGNAEKILRERGYHVVILDKDYSIRNLKNIYTLYRLFKKMKPDIVHTAAAEANFHGIIAAKLAGIKGIIGEEVGIPNHSRIARKVFAIVYYFANKVVCVSKAVKSYLIDIKEITEKKGIVVYNPVNTPLISLVENSLFFFNIVYVGRLEKVKNVETLIKGFSKIKRIDVRLTIVGDGRERQKLQELCVNLKVLEKVTFVGFSETPHEYLKYADLFILPSYSEGFGIAVVEAMLMKIPVLCSEVGGIPEFVEEGKTGWLFNPYNEEEFVDKLNNLLAIDKSELKRIGLEGYHSVNNLYTLEKYTQNLENLYERILRKN